MAEAVQSPGFISQATDLFSSGANTVCGWCSAGTDCVVTLYNNNLSPLLEKISDFSRDAFSNISQYASDNPTVAIASAVVLVGAGILLAIFMNCICCGKETSTPPQNSTTGSASRAASATGAEQSLSAIASAAASANASPSPSAQESGGSA